MDLCNEILVKKLLPEDTKNGREEDKKGKMNICFKYDNKQSAISKNDVNKWSYGDAI